jgi:hypothetical protein
MKRFRLLALLATLTIVLSSCYQESIVLHTDDEFDRIKELIPDAFDKDVILPSTSEGYTIKYVIDDQVLIDQTIIFEQKEEDEFIHLYITISNGNVYVEYNLLLKQLGDVDKYQIYLKEKIISDASLLITNSIPSFVTSNITLPDFADSPAQISYSTPCTTIVRNRLEYTFPTQATSCTLNATIQYFDSTESIDIDYIMVALDDLPKVPSIYINTNYSNTINSKDNYTSSVLNVIDYNDTTNNITNASIGIRLRGNSTLDVPKKSYKIKFDTKSTLLSTYAEKDWVLLANYMDQTLIRDYVAFELSNNLKMSFTPRYTFVDLYINDIYQGNYLLTDQIEVTNDRVNIEENEPRIDTGYLIEYDVGLYRTGLEESDENYFLVDWIPFVIKSPDIDDDHYLTSQRNYISQYMNNLLFTLQNKSDYSSLIDEATFIDWYIVNEVFKNVDSGYSSVYFYKDKGSLLKMGPVWDFDLSSGAYGHLDAELRGAEGFYTSNSDRNIFFHYLMQYDSFKHNLKERWNEIYTELLLELPNNVLLASNSFTASRYNNFHLWDIIGIDNQWYTSPELLALDTYDEQVWFLYDFLFDRVEWLNTEINKFN